MPLLGQWDLCGYVNIHISLPPSPVTSWIELDGKPKWLPLDFGYHDVMRTSAIYLSVGQCSMGLVRIASWYPNFNGSHVGLRPSEIHRMTHWTGWQICVNYDVFTQAPLHSYHFMFVASSVLYRC